MNSLSVLLFARNEERGLARRLEAVAAISPARIVIVDAFSTDRTVEVAQAAGAEVIQRQFVEASSQFQWACDAARISTDWVMALDVNEWLEPGLAAEIAATLPTLGPEISGVRLQLRRTFLGRAIRYGGRGPRSRLRIWRAGLKPFGLPSSDGQCVSRARTVSLVSGYVDHKVDDLTSFIEQQNAASSQDAADRVATGERSTVLNGPCAQFVRGYIFQLGFLDGRAGLICHFLHSFGYELFVAAKTVEHEHNLRAAARPSPTQKIALRHESPDAAVPNSSFAADLPPKDEAFGSVRLKQL